MDKVKFNSYSDLILNINSIENIGILLCNSICHQILLNPVQCSECNENFCFECIQFWLLNTKHCPHCKKIFSTANADILLLEELKKLQFKCVNNNNGCEDIINYDHIEEHNLECGYKKKLCNFCKQNFIQKEIDLHHNTCKMKETECLGCNKSYKPDELLDHDMIGCMKIKINLYEKIVNRIKNARFYWKWMNPSIYLTNDKKKAIQTKDLNKLSGVCILKPKFRKLKSLKIRVTNLTCWIGFGISTYDQVNSQNYTFSDYSIERMKHGGYMISTNGLKWSSTDKKENFDSSFYFGQNDFIEMTYNSEQKKLIFQKTSLYSSQSLQVSLSTDIPTNNLFYPIVVLGGVGDEVEIVSSTPKTDL